MKVASANTEEDVFEVIKTVWPLDASNSVFVSPSDEGTLKRLRESGWNTVYSGSHLIFLCIFRRICPFVQSVDQG